MRDQTIDGRVYGRPYQSILEASTVQKYPIGTIYEAFGKKFVYCKAWEEITIAHRGCPTLIPATWDEAEIYSLGSDGCTAEGYEGEDWLLLTLGAAYDGTGRGVDVFQGGVLTLFPAAPRDNEILEFRVMGNDVSYTATLADDRIKVYIDPPLQEDIDDWPVDVLSSPYRFVGNPGSGSGNHAFVVVSPIIVPQYSFFWGQVAGPCWVTPSAGWTTVNVRMAVFHTDGTVVPMAEVGNAEDARQVAGFILPHNDTDDDSHIMLMIG
jgi:hypothetical protein